MNNANGSPNLAMAAATVVGPQQPQHYLRIHTHSNEVNVLTTSTTTSTSQPRQHSRSPSDGMILTASVLRDTMSSENNVVIVDGLHPNDNAAVNNSVYLTTS